MHYFTSTHSPLVIATTIASLTAFGASRTFAQAQDITAIRDLKCLTNDTLKVGALFPAILRDSCNKGDSTYRIADTALEADNFRIAYNPFGHLRAVAGNAECVGACKGGKYERNPSPDQDFKNVRVSEGSRVFLDSTTLIQGEDIIVHLPKGFNGPREHGQGLANGIGTRDIVVMLHGWGGLGEAALSQLANMKSIQDLPGNGPVLLLPNAGNNLRMSTHQWAWDSWNTGCQSRDTGRIESGTPVQFREYPSENPADPYDDGFDDACASDLKRILKLVYDLKANNKWVRRVVLAGFSSGGHMTKTVFCTYPSAFDGYALFEHDKLIGTPAQSLCGDLDATATGYAGFLSSLLDSLFGVRPEDLAVNKRPLFHVCSDQDDACSDDLGALWSLRDGKADTLVTDRVLERQVIDHTEVDEVTRKNYALVRVPDSASLATLGSGQYSWKEAGLEYRAQTTLGTYLPPSVGALVTEINSISICSDSKPGAASQEYDTHLCTFEDANNGDAPSAPDDKTFHSILEVGIHDKAVASPPDDIVAVRYVEKQNGAAYGFIEVHGGGHTIHGANHRADFGKSRDFESFLELLKFMRYAMTDPPAIAKSPRAKATTRSEVKAAVGILRQNERDALGRKAAASPMGPR